MTKDDIWQGRCQATGLDSACNLRVVESCTTMRKDTRLTFRVPSELKKNMEAIATQEGRSMAQICEAFLRAGSEVYKKEGPKFLHRFLGRQKSTS
jgi:hypothetical protein